MRDPSMTEGLLRFGVRTCFLGLVLVATSGRGVRAIALGSESEELVESLLFRYPRSEAGDGDPAFDSILAQIVRLIEEPGRPSDLTLDPRGTPFQRRVWEALRQIPPGETLTYAALARRLGVPEAVRAVAQACGANELAIAIPCHRVLRSDGGLAGYRWGIERKRTLLEREAALRRGELPFAPA